MSVGIGRERQSEVYVSGARGAYPRVPVSLERLEQSARTSMSPEVHAYVAGGAGTERPCARTALPSSAGASSHGCSATFRYGTLARRYWERRCPAPSSSARSESSRWPTATPMSRWRGPPRQRAFRSCSPTRRRARWRRRRRRWEMRRAGSSFTGALRTNSSKVLYRAPSGAAARPSS